MEHSIKMEKTCRTCLRSPDMLLPLFEDEQLSEKIETVTSVQICKTDQLPTEICAECVININLAYSFRRVVINSDRELKRRITSLFVSDDITIDEIKLDQTNDISEPESVEDLLMENGSDMEDKPVETEIIMKDSTKIKLETGLNLEEGSNNKLKVDLVKDYFYKCKVCNFRTPDYAEYKDHLKTKLQVPKSVCSICGKSIRADNLNRHMTIHTEPPVQCKHCGKTCKNTESLRGHLFIHKNVKLKCKICGKVYTYRSGFRQHIKRHTLGDVKTVPCSICSKQFYDKQTMDKHIRSHTGERPYPCEYCKKGFSSSYALKTHKRRHTNEKPYLCEFCPMAFPQKVSLRTHYKSKHPEATDRT